MTNDHPDIPAAVRRTRELAHRLAATADDVARSFEHAAEVHDDIAKDVDHPLHASAAGRAAAEREFADAERSESARLHERVEPA